MQDAISKHTKLVYFNENVCMQVQVKVFISISAVPVEGLKSQKYFDELRLTYINELDRLINYGRKTNCAMRFQQLTRLMDSLQPVSNMHTRNHIHIDKHTYTETPYITFISVLHALLAP